MKKWCGFLIAIILVVGCVWLLSPEAQAATEGYYTYTVSNGQVTITKCDTSISGTITIPSALGGYPVTTIHSAAFQNCSSLTTVAIPDSITSIGGRAFIGCSNLTYVNFGNGVTAVGDYTFQNCSSLTGVAIGKSVTSIGKYAFQNCSGLQSIIIPDSVTDIGGYVFNGCSGMTSLTISNGITEIDKYAFCGCSRLTEVVIPNSVTWISPNAFKLCSSLQSITIPASVTLIGQSAFARCSSLTNVTYAGTEEQWERLMYDLKYGEATGNDPLLDATVLFASEDPKVTALEIVALPDKTEYWIGEELDLTGLVVKSLWTDGTDKVVTPNCTVSGYDATTPGTHTITVSYENFTTAFTVMVKNDGQCGEELTWVIDNNGTLTISGTGKMTDFVNSEVVPWYQLRDDIKKVVIEKGATSIGQYAFSYCGNLAEITIPSGVLEIGGYAFERTHSLKQVTLPAGLQTMGSYLFYRSEGLESIVIPDSVTSLGASTFSRCINLRQVSIGAGVTKLEKYTFYTCTGLTEITVPDSVTELGEQVFENCSGLAAVTLGRHLTAIGKKSFSGCASLQDVYYRNTAAKWAQITVGDTNESLFAATLHTREEAVAAAIVGQPKDVLAQVGDTVNFTVIAEGDGLTYKWQYKNAGATAWNNTSLTGYNTNTLTLYNVQGAGYHGRQFRCIVTDANGNTVTSEPATLSVPYIVKQPATAFGAAVNSNHQFTVAYSISEGVSYQWQYKGNTASSKWANTSMSGAKTNTLTVPAIATRNGYKYRCIINDNGTQLITKEVTLYVQAAAATITKQPVAAAAVCGDYATFTVEAAGEGLTYQWQWYHEETQTWVDTKIAGYHTNTLKVKTNNYNGGRLYRCVIKTVNGSAYNKVYSESALMTVLPAAEVTQQPQNVTVKVGENATFHVEAAGEGLTYQWQWAKFVGNWKNTTAAGNTTDTLTISNVSKEMNGRYYRVIITNQYTGTITTTYAQLFVE